MAALGMRAAEALPETLKISSLLVQEADLLVTPKNEYVHVIFDAYPYRSQIKKAGKGFAWRRAVKDLAETVVFKRNPQMSRAKIVIVEYSERDDYGAPVWETVQKLGEFEVRLQKNGDILTEELKAPVSKKK
jgi:hypothetical protein